jgi:hypothetical protein
LKIRRRILLRYVRMGDLQCVASEARRTGRTEDKHRSLPINGIFCSVHPVHN